MIDEPNRQVNRRNEPRYRQSGERLRWRTNVSRGAKAMGWLNDIFATGLSFLVDFSRSPRVGQDLDVLWKCWGEQTLYEVVRTRPTCDRLTLVGCRKIVGTPAGARPPDRGARRRIAPAPKSPAALCPPPESA